MSDVELPLDDCPVAHTLDIVGERWSLLIIRDAFYGIRRFEAWRAHLGISKKVLAQRLRTLVDAGIFRRDLYQRRPDRYEYRLTASGRDLFPVLLTMQRWGKRWSAGERSEGLQLLHHDCGEIVEPKLVCDHCDGPLTPARVQVVSR